MAPYYVYSLSVEECNLIIYNTRIKVSLLILDKLRRKETMLYNSKTVPSIIDNLHYAKILIVNNVTPKRQPSVGIAS